MDADPPPYGVKLARRNTRIETSIYSTLPQYRIENARGATAQAQHIDWCIETLKLKFAKPSQIADVVFRRQLVPEQRAIEEFGDERVQSARDEGLVPEDVTAVTVPNYKLFPSCAFVPHAFEPTSSQCGACHLRGSCGAQQPRTLQLVAKRYGHEDPLREHEKAQTRKRVEAFRARAKAGSLVVLEASGA